MDDRDIKLYRRHCRKLLAGVRANNFFDARIYAREFRSAVAAEYREWQPCRRSIVSVRHRGVRMLDDLDLVRPAVLVGVPETVQRADARIAAPGKRHALGAAHADQLVVNQIRRHADQREAFAFLADDFMPRRKGNEMREAFHGNRVAILHVRFDRLREREKFSH